MTGHEWTDDVWMMYGCMDYVQMYELCTDDILHSTFQAEVRSRHARPDEDAEFLSAMDLAKVGWSHWGPCAGILSLGAMYVDKF